MKRCLTFMLVYVLVACVVKSTKDDRHHHKRYFGQKATKNVPQYKLFPASKNDDSRNADENRTPKVAADPVSDSDYTSGIPTQFTQFLRVSNYSCACA